MSYSGVKIFTLSEGEVSHLHVGLKGTMNALFLKDLADKPRRGQRGRVEADKSGGGNSYGYDVVKKRSTPTANRSGATAPPMRCQPKSSAIFRDYAARKSAKIITFALNEGIPGPTSLMRSFGTMWWT
jgi:hypothetical protein